MNNNVAIIGGGIVGLAIGRELLLRGYKDIKIIEKEGGIASHQSSRNSGVMHSGLYYKPGSLKAKLSREGIKLLKEFCINKKIKFEECGKVVIAKNISEKAELNNLFEKGKRNELIGIEKITMKTVNQREPNVIGVEGLLVPEEGIVNYREVANCLMDDIKNMGGQIFLNTRIVRLDESNNSQILISSQKEKFEADIIISSSGLYSDKTAELLGFKLKQKQIIPFRGEYYCLKEKYRNLVSHLIYPVPNPKFPFLGVHFTRMINGEVEAGPNAVLALSREGYSWRDINLLELFDTLKFKGLTNFIYKYPKTTFGEVMRSFNKEIFTKSLQEFIPEINSNMLIKGEPGVRAQLMNETGDLIQDFDIVHKKNKIAILNAPSPAATSSLSIARYIAEFIQK